MKASIEWLEEYSDIDVDSVKLGDILTMTGSKVETVEQRGNDIKNVVVGKILEIEKHPDADKLVVTKVDVKTEILQIVTGANNIKVNDIVPIAKDGAEFLSKLGMSEIEAVGQRFDPSLHEAVSHIEDPDKGEQEIVEEYRKGYKIGDKVIRHSMVIVAN